MSVYLYTHIHVTTSCNKLCMNVVPYTTIISHSPASLQFCSSSDAGRAILIGILISVVLKVLDWPAGKLKKDTANIIKSYFISTIHYSTPNSQTPTR